MKRGPRVTKDERRRMRRAELDGLIVSGELAGRAMHLQVLHDDRCTPTNCSCDPDLVLEPLTVESIQRGAAAERRWIRETTS